MGSTQPARDTRSPPGAVSLGAQGLSQTNNASFSSRYTTSPSAERRSFETGSPPHHHAQGMRDGPSTALPTLLLRRLPPNMHQEALYSMMLFADDFQNTRFVEANDEQGFQSAVAEFRSVEGAREAQNRLHGKQNAISGARMIVDLLSPGVALPNPLNTEVAVDGLGIRRQLSNPTSSRAGSNSGPRQSSRYFHSMGEKINANTMPPAQVDGEETPMFSPRSPHSNSFREHMRQTGKSMISEDADDETGELLKDPVAYARSNPQGSTVRRSNSGAQHPVSRMGGLSLNTAQNKPSNGVMMSPTGGAYTNNMSHQAVSPSAELPNPLMSNGIAPISPTNSGYPISPTHMPQRHLPPANPADQNPPCNTLYVGNLPIDTSEDELKAIFSKQRGYKRLCFRTKHNGPMCFVEFEDVSFATKALNELYGHTLHNSVKGGIRLSFSKNPLGVRTGQASALNPGSPLGSPGSAGGFGGPGAFSGVSGPPPGLGAPPGLNSPPMSAGVPGSAAANNGGFAQFFGPSSPPLGSSGGPGNGRYGGYMNNQHLGHIGTGP
ncbi:MAG: hypothetical protein Q9159_001933 [Coniocarpon cinnabarinum]